MSLQSVFEELIDLSPEQRVERLRTLSLTDGERARLRSMLEVATTEQLPLLDMPVDEVIGQLRPDEAAFTRLVGRMVGPFRVLELIGEGGSAAVFRASRPAGSGEQLVALKVLRASMFSADGERRFRREQAILAQLTHPNVARLIEGGVDAAGNPYMAMELVDGEPITRAASRRKLGLTQRLEWFLSLCRTIDAAHQSLVVHCDLKPSNVLVDRDDVIKVLDFGIARLIDTTREDHPTRTIALTPEYAAPEQFQLGPPRVSVDVYALGIILGELLTGQRLGVAAGKPASIAVADSDAAQPPAGLPRREILARQLSGDLDAILTMATEEDPANRYRSAGALAEDVERYLTGRPVSARFPTRRYRLRKFVGRHRIAVATTALVTLALLTGLGVAWWQAIVAQRAAREAQAQTARANSMRDMVFDVFSEAEPNKPRQAETTVSEAAEHAIATLLTERSADPRARLELLTRLADTVGRQGHPDRAQELLERALIESRELLGQADNLTLDIGVRLAGYETQHGSYDAARQRIDKLLAQIPPEVTELRIRALRASSSTAWHMHDRERALADGNIAVALSKQLGDAEIERETLTSYGATLLGVGAVPEAVTVYEKLLALNTAKYGPTHEQVALAWSGLSRAYRRSGNLEKAEDASHHALDIDRIIYPNDHWITANHLNALTMILVQKRDYEGAAEASREGLRITVNTLGENHIDRLSPAYQLGYALMMMERYAEALPYLRDVFERRAKLQGLTQHETIMARATYAYDLGMSGEAKAGAAELEQAYEDAAKVPTPDFDLMAKTVEKRIRLALASGDAETASTLIEPFASAVAKTPAPENLAWIGKTDTLRGEVLLALNRPREAREALLRAGKALEAGTSTDLVEPLEQKLLLAKACAASNDLAAARVAASEARRKMGGVPNPPSRLTRLAEALPK
ncbi:MAG TPA: protein kinase [Rhodanobacteraceae bacterium]|nr:protein kinase [Rhodanobacteraceae bacterium]